MRVIIYGVGAIGGVVAVALVRAGHEVIGIARGAQLAALQGGGLAAAHTRGRSGGAGALRL